VSARSAGARRGWEHRRERIARVIAELSPEAAALYRARGCPAGETWETAAEYLEEHPGEGMAALQAEADRALERLLRTGPPPPSDEITTIDPDDPRDWDLEIEIVAAPTWTPLSRYLTTRRERHHGS
jgi:hypothetical protein